MYAAQYGHMDILSILIANGADPTLKNIDGHSALKKAEIKGHTDIVAYLMKQAS